MDTRIHEIWRRKIKLDKVNNSKQPNQKKQNPLLIGVVIFFENFTNRVAYNMWRLVKARDQLIENPVYQGEKDQIETCGS